ncbi:MAG TPA: type II secretion system protein GspG [Terriglobia bacterium]|nr:type II secretion system protein GspG [Terriglobia bacterium]
MNGSSRYVSRTLRIGALACALTIAGMATGCSSARLSHDEARRQIAEIGNSSLVPDSIHIQRIVSQTEKDAIAETSIAMAFEFQRAKSSDPWHISAVRMGDRDWVGVAEIIAAVNESRKRTTLESFQKLARGIEAYRQQNGTSPNATDIVSLTNILHPTYMTDLVRLDAWGRPIRYEVTGASFRLLSDGADGIRGTADDLQLAP